MTEQEITKNERKATAELYLKQAAEIARLRAVINTIIENVDRGDFIITVAGTYDEPEHPANLDFAREVLRGQHS